MRVRRIARLPSPQNTHRWNNPYANCLLGGKVPQWVEDSGRYKPANARNFFVGLDALGEEFAVPKQRIRGDRRGRTFGRSLYR